MKSMTTKIFALTAAFCGLQLSAANPVAVWDGDFTTTTKGGWTLSSTGSTITDAKITIGSTPITMTPSTTQNCGWYTIVYKVKGLKNTSQTPLATWGRPEVAGYNNPDLVGAFLDTDYPWGVWDGAERTKYSLQKKINLSSAGAEEHRVVVRFHSGVNYGVWAYVDGTKVFTADKDLKSSIDINRMTILGFQYNSGNVLTGAEVTSLAIFCDASDAGDAAFTSYKFPSDPQAISVNFNASTSARTVTGDPGAVYSDSNWHNLTGKSGTDVVIDNVKISYSASGVYNNDDMDKSYNKGYLDDNNSTHTTVTVSNLKNGYYNLVIYCSSDNATRFSYKTVNGKDYTYDSTTGAAKEGTASWGSNATSSAEPGNHALLIRNLKVDNGTIAIDSLRRDEGETRVRGSISAIQIAEVPYEATVTGDTNWANLNWTPTTPPSGADVKLINNGADGVTTITLADNVSVGKLMVESAAGKELKIANFATKMTATSYDFSKAPGGVGLDVSTGYTISGENPLRRYIRDNNVKVKFYGSGEKGVSIVNGYDLNKAIQGHWVFEGGKHSMTYGNSIAGGSAFGANASFDNPTILVKGGTTLDFTGKDLSYWNGTVDLKGVIKVEDGGRINMKDDSSTVDGGTVYYRQRIALNPGAEFYIDMAANNFRLQGGTDSDKEQLYVPAGSGTAYIKPADASRDSIYLAKDETRGFGVFVGTGSTLDIQTKIACYEDSSNKNNFEIAKRGTGTLKLSGDISGYWNQGYDGAVVKFSMYAGDMELAMAQAVKCQIWFQSGTNLKLTGNETDISGYLDGPGKVVCNSTGTVTISRAENTYTGGTEIRSGTLKIGGAASLGTGTITFAGGTLDLNGQTLTGKTISGSGTIVNSSNTAASINGVSVAAGKSYTITEGKFSIIVPEGETLTLTALPPNGMVTIGGAGKVAYTTSGTNPAYPTWTWIAEGDDAWTGTYALTGFTTATAAACGENGWDLRSYYNGTNSVFEVVGSSASATVEGYFNNVSISVGELVLNGAIKIVDGYSDYTYSFTRISGSKAFTVNTSKKIAVTVKFVDISAFTGTLSISSPKRDDKKCYCVIVGDGTLPVGYTSDMSSIYLTGDTVLNGTTLNASNGVKVNGDAVVTVPAGKRPTCSSGAMTLEDGSSVVFGNGSCNLTANGGLSIASNVKIPLAITNGKDLTAGAILVNWSGTQPTGDFSFSIESGVEAGHSGFKASKNASNLTAVADTTKTYYEVEGGETTTTFDNQWLTTAGVTGSTAEQVQEKLDTPNANGIKMSDVYLMGYEAKDAQNAAVILKPDQAQSNGETISLSVAGVPNETRNGAVITYTALASADRNWESPTETVPMGTGSVSMALPTSGVLYYRVQATVALP